MEEPFEVQEGYILLGSKGVYMVEKFIGEGTFGKVAKCQKIGTNENLAIKIVKKEFKRAGEKEIQVLREVSMIDADQHNLVKCLDCFLYKSHPCVAFEMLDVNFHDFMQQRSYLSLSICNIRSVASQLLAALDALKSIGVVHCDIKLDNVMLVDRELQPYKVKLIDFGLAARSSELLTGTRMQNLSYRAPEVILGLPLDEGLDMWTLGYGLAVLYTGIFIHAWDSEYNVVRAMVELQGMPESAVLDIGKYTRKFFSLVQRKSRVMWELDTPERHMNKTGEKVNTDHCKYFDTYDEMVGFYYDESKIHEARQFVDLLKRMLTIDPAKRITPRDALRHPFFTMEQQPLPIEEDSAFAQVPIGPQEDGEAATLDQTHRTTSNQHSCAAVHSENSCVCVRSVAALSKPGTVWTSGDRKSPEVVSSTLTTIQSQPSDNVRSASSVIVELGSDDIQFSSQSNRTVIDSASKKGSHTQELIREKGASPSKKSFRRLRKLVSRAWVPKLFRLRPPNL